MHIAFSSTTHSREEDVSVAMSEGVTGLEQSQLYKVCLVIEQKEGFCSFDG